MNEDRPYNGGRCQQKFNVSGQLVRARDLAADKDAQFDTGEMLSAQARGDDQVQDSARTAGARKRALFDGARRAPGRERPRGVLLPMFRCSDVVGNWRHIGTSTP